MTTITNSKGRQVQVYTDRAEFTYHEVILPIEAGDASRDDFDVDAIADELIEWHDEHIIDSEGNPAIWMPQTGYCNNIAEDDEVTFWSTVEANAR